MTTPAGPAAATNKIVPPLGGVAQAAAAIADPSGGGGGGGGGGDSEFDVPPMPDALKAIRAVIAGVVPPKRAQSAKSLPASESPRLTFEEGDAADDIPYRFDGDEAMETADARKKRRALRKHPQIVQWLKVFFRTFRDHDDATGVHKTEYIEVHCLMTKALHK